MHQGAGRILRLPAEVAAQIKSSTVIPSLANVVVSLVENALDAQAAKIRINVDYVRGACTVEDDGHGIPPQEFLEDGGLGKPCCEFVEELWRGILTDIDRHIKAQLSTCCLWKTWHVPGFCGCSVHPDHHISSSMAPVPFYPHSTSFKAGRKARTGTLTPATLQPQSWHQGHGSRPFWKHASQGQAASSQPP